MAHMATVPWADPQNGDNLGLGRDALSLAGVYDRYPTDTPCNKQYWVAVKELNLRDYPPIMENQMEKNMENEMETGGM